MKYSTKSLSEKDTELIAMEIAPMIEGSVVYLQGTLGAGKTTLVKYIAKHLGFDPVVYSPTFSIANRYVHGSKQMLHFDLYRIESDEELDMTGFYELIEEEGTIIIEWADKFKDIDSVINNPFIVEMSVINDTERNIKLYKK